MTQRLMMFRPETYANVKVHGTIGVRIGAGKQLKAFFLDAPFLADLSHVVQLDGIGTVKGEAFEHDSPLLSDDKLHEHRRKVTSPKSGVAHPVAGKLGLFSCFQKEMRMTPSNYTSCTGGIIEGAKDDFKFRARVMRDDEEPSTLRWRHEGDES